MAIDVIADRYRNILCISENALCELDALDGLVALVNFKYSYISYHFFSLNDSCLSEKYFISK